MVADATCISLTEKCPKRFKINLIFIILPQKMRRKYRSRFRCSIKSAFGIKQRTRNNNLIYHFPFPTDFITTDFAFLFNRIEQIVQFMVCKVIFRLSGFQHMINTFIRRRIIKITHNNNVRMGRCIIDTINFISQNTRCEDSFIFTFQFSASTRWPMIDKNMQSITVWNNTCRIQNISRKQRRKRRAFYANKLFVYRSEFISLIQKSHINPSNVRRVLMNKIIIKFF